MPPVKNGEAVVLEGVNFISLDIIARLTAKPPDPTTVVQDKRGICLRNAPHQIRMCTHLHHSVEVIDEVVQRVRQVLAREGCHA